MVLSRFFFQKSMIEPEFVRLRLVQNNVHLDWTNDITFATHNSSKYAAKKHLKSLQANFKLSDTVTIVEMERK